VYFYNGEENNMSESEVPIAILAMDAMKLIIEWDKMYSFCMPDNINTLGKKCSECPYFENNVCSKESTASILHKTALIFDEFLEEELAID
jgi:hypothetical protein